jgi:hypothetical protein
LLFLIWRRSELAKALKTIGTIAGVVALVAGTMATFGIGGPAVAAVAAKVATYAGPPAEPEMLGFKKWEEDLTLQNGFVCGSRVNLYCDTAWLQMPEGKVATFYPKALEGKRWPYAITTTYLGNSEIDALPAWIELDDPSDTGELLKSLRGAQRLANAESSAEVLDARDMARMVYDTAKSAARLARAKQAHDEIIGTVYRAQADALAIEAAAKARLADEYDAAQERGELRAANTGRSTSALEAPSASDLGLSHKEIHEARQIRDAERADAEGRVTAPALALVPWEAAAMAGVLLEPTYLHRKSP